MFKKSFFLCIGGICAAFSQANAEVKVTPLFTLYGVGHLSADHNDNGSENKDTLASNSSRLGIKANYTLSEQFTLLGQFEMGVDLTSAGDNDGNGGKDGNQFFTNARDSFIGAQGNWGTIKAGRQGILNQWVYDYNLFADQVGDLGNIWGGSGIPGRADNVISYESPQWQGFSGALFYTPESNTGADDKAFVIKANYTSGMFAAGIDQAVIDQGSLSGNNHKVTALTASVNAQNLNLSGLDISGSSIGVGFQTESDIGGTGGNDRNSYTLGGALKINGQHTIKAQYALSDSDLAGQDAHQIAAGYDYAWNKNLSLYLAYARTANGSLAAFTANDYGHGKSLTPSAGNDAQSFSAGVVFNFDYDVDTGFFHRFTE